jgi:hypothetical protein
MIASRTGFQEAGERFEGLEVTGVDRAQLEWKAIHDASQAVAVSLGDELACLPSWMHLNSPGIVAAASR